MPAWSEEVAVTFVRWAEERQVELDQLQLQALVYIAHGWRLATSGEPLTGDRPVITEFGPEYERIAHALRGCGIHPVRLGDIPDSGHSVLDQDELDLISSTLDTHGSLNASQLATITRDEGSPWQRRVRAEVGREIGHNEIWRQFEAYSNGEEHRVQAEEG